MLLLNYNLINPLQQDLSKLPYSQIKYDPITDYDTHICMDQDE